MAADPPQARAAPEAMTSTAAAAAAHDPSAQQQGTTNTKHSSLAAKLKGTFFLSLLVVMAALSTTVLRKPLLASADWLRAQGTAGYAVIGAVGFAFLMVSGSSHLFDLCCGFFCGPLPGAS